MGGGYVWREAVARSWEVGTVADYGGAPAEEGRGGWCLWGGAAEGWACNTMRWCGIVVADAFFVDFVLDIINATASVIIVDTDASMIRYRIGCFDICNN